MMNNVKMQVLSNNVLMLYEIKVKFILTLNQNKETNNCDMKKGREMKFY